VNGARELIIRNLNPVSLADLRENETEPYTAVRNLTVFLARLCFGRAFRLECHAPLFHVLLDGLPDSLKLLLDERGRRVELVRAIELVEEFTLDLLARCKEVLVRQTLADLLLQLVRGFDTESLRERIIDSQRVGCFHRLDRDVELCVAASHALGRIIIREFH